MPTWYACVEVYQQCAIAGASYSFGASKPDFRISEILGQISGISKVLGRILGISGILRI